MSLGPATARRRRVLHVIQNLNYGGMERMLGDLVRGFDPQAVESHVLVLQYLGRFAEGLETFATLHKAPAMPRWSLLRPTALAQTIRAIAPDVVHSHSGVWYKASLAARMARVERFIHTEHGRASPDPWIARRMDGMASSRTDVAVAVSKSVADMLERTIVKGRCRVEIVLNGIDTDRFRPRKDTGDLRRELGVDAHTPVIGSVGRLELIKGYDVMIDAFASLLESSRVGSPPILVIAGDGAQRTELERRLRSYGLNGRVHLLGWRDDVESLLAAFDCFTMSSRSEGTSISLLEAMSSGNCPIVTDVGGNRAVLGPALAHRLVPSERPAALAGAWAQALADQRAREADADAARERVLTAYSAASMVAAYERLYAGTSARPRPQGSARAGESIVAHR